MARLLLLVAALGSGCSNAPVTLPVDGGADATPACPAEAAVVATGSGCVRGEAAGAALAFRGIPFAAAPVGPLRFRLPAPAPAWDGVRDTIAFAKACPQINPTLGGTVLASSEDCLYLNVWTPAADAAARPVMLWIHGGGLQNGAASQPAYDGRYFAENAGVVLVSINYRLGQLGFLAHPALSAEDTAHAASGNYGLHDQIAALAWVKANIARFGGDPDRVTIFGESAGGLSVCSLLASPLATGLYHRAIIESASCPTLGNFARPLKPGGIESAEEQGGRFATAAGCTGDDVAACLRALPVEQILKTLQAIPGLLGTGERYGMSVDGWALPLAPAAAVDAGDYAHVPVLIGSNGNEGSVFTTGLGINTVPKYEAYVNAVFGANGPGVLQRYPAAAYPTPKAALDAVITHAVFTCPARTRARAFASHQPAIWVYQLSHVTAFGAQQGLGAWHGSELEFVFGTIRNRMNPAPAGELALSDAMMAYWADFARTGDPNGAGVAWPAYTTASDPHLDFAIPIVAGRDLERANCDFFDGIGL